MKRHLGGLMGWLYLILAMSVLPVFAQDCPTIVENALANIEAICKNSTGRNQVCYGNAVIQAIPHAGVVSFNFDSVNDIEDLTEFSGIRLSALNVPGNQWGVAWMQVQASLENSFPQDITFLMFGDVDMENKVLPLIPNQAAFIHTTEGDELNVRIQPSTSASVLVALANGTRVTVLEGPTVTGNLNWWKIRLNNGAEGWVVDDVDDNGERLATLVRDLNVLYGPVQLATVATGANDRPCSLAPESGILIQTPEGAGEISILMNEIDIRLGSTLFIQSVPAGDMTINLIEGNISVSANNVTRDLVDGQRVRIPISNDLVPVSIPSEIEGIDPEDLIGLPLDLLPDPIGIGVIGTSDGPNTVPVYNGRGNLRISSLSSDYNGSNAQAISIQRLTITIMNDGLETTPSTAIQIYVRDFNYAYTEVVPAMAAGQVFSVSVDISGQQTGFHSAIVTVDPAHVVQETNEDDNSQTLRIEFGEVVQ